MFDSNNISVNLYRQFIVVAESGSIAEASDKLGYSRENVSMSVSTLEKQLGVKLFTRKPLKLTDIGKEIYATVKEGFANIDFAMLIAKSKNDIEYLQEVEIKEIKNIENIFISKEKIIIKDINELNNYKYIISYENKVSTTKLIETIKHYNLKLNSVLRCPTTEQRINAAKLGIGIAYVMKEAAKKN